MEALRRSGCEFVIAPGDGAFYGPKIEYTLKDALGRQWQLGTMQVDFNTAERLGGDYVTETSGRAFPVMLHRAIVGSFERFIGILLEHHAGALPAWLAPVQASVLNISESSADYAREVAKSLQKQGLRVDCDLRNEKITYKIREHSLQKVPYILVVGDKEKANGAVAVRARGNHDLGVMSARRLRREDRRRHRPKGCDSPGRKRHSGRGRAFIVYGLRLPRGSLKGFHIATFADRRHPQCRAQASAQPGNHGS